MSARFPGRGAGLSALHAASFGGLGIWVPFFPVWLGERAIQPVLIGVMLAAPILVRVVATAPLMSLVDRGLGPRRLMIAAAAGAACAYAALTLAEGPLAIMLLVALASLAHAPIIPTSDLVTIQAIRRDPRLDYGRIRLWGSIAFLAANIVGGHLLGLLGAGAVIGMLIAFALACMAIAAAVVPRAAVPAPGQDRDAAPAASRAGAGQAACLPRALRYVIAAAACTQACHASLYAFGSIHWRGLGFPTTAIGYLWAVGVMAEILLFAAAGRRVGRGSAGIELLIVGSVAAIVRFAALAAEPPLGATFLLQALHGLSFGATHLGTMAALAALAPESGRGRAQGITSATQAVASAGATLVGGAVFPAGGALAFLAMVPLGGAGLAFAALAARAARPQPQSAGEGG